MEIKLPLAGLSPTQASQGILSEPQRYHVPVRGMISQIDLKNDQEKDANLNIVQGTADLLALIDANLRFEVLEDAGVVQLQIVRPNGASGDKIIRKIPSDEVIRFISYLKERMSEHLDVQL